MDAREYERMIASVAAEMAAPDFFPVTMPENELHPDPASLRADLVALRYRVSDLEKRITRLEGMPSNVHEFPRR